MFQVHNPRQWHIIFVLGLIITSPFHLVLVLPNMSHKTYKQNVSLFSEHPREGNFLYSYKAVATYRFAQRVNDYSLLNKIHGL